jgi:hypothetical protein
MPPTSALAVYGGRDSVRLCRRQRWSPHDHTLRSRLPACPHTGSTVGSTSNGAINPPPADTFPVITQLHQLVTRFEGADARKPAAGSGPQRQPRVAPQAAGTGAHVVAAEPLRLTKRQLPGLGGARCEPYDLAEALPGWPDGGLGQPLGLLEGDALFARAGRQSGSARSASIRCSVPARSCLARRASSRARSFTRRARS